MKEPKLIPTLNHPKELIGKTITHVQMAEEPNDDQFNMIVLDGKYPFFAAGWQDIEDVSPEICSNTEKALVEQFCYYQESLKWLSKIGIVNYADLQFKYHAYLNSMENQKKEKDLKQLSALMRQYPSETTEIVHSSAWKYPDGKEFLNG